jgi:hypothetical protein
LPVLFRLLSLVSAAQYRQYGGEEVTQAGYIPLNKRFTTEITEGTEKTGGSEKTKQDDDTNKNSPDNCPESDP